MDNFIPTIPLILPAYFRPGFQSLDITLHPHLVVISLACVSSETHNLQRVFRPGESPLYRLYGYVRRQRVCFFQPFWSEIGYQFRPFWSEIGYSLCTLVLNWVCFLEELTTSSSFGVKTISLLMFTSTTVYVPLQLVMLSGHAPGSRASGLKKVGKITDFGLK